MAPEQDIEQLKKDWIKSPTWYIEYTPGFEDKYNELIDFKYSDEAADALTLSRKIMKKAIELKCSNELAFYIIKLETELDNLHERISDIYKGESRDC